MMDNNETAQNDFEKKTERLDVRVSHKKKKAFSTACENQGDTPSNAVRRFITSYIRRDKHDNLGAKVRKFRWRRTLIGGGAVIVIGFSAAVLWGYAYQFKQNRIADTVFEVYDENSNDIIEIGEIAPNDFHLHRVLNIDGQKGISRDEFYTKGVMVWKFVNPDNFQITEEKKGLFFHRTVATSTFDGLDASKSKVGLEIAKKYGFIAPNAADIKNLDDAAISLGVKSHDIAYQEWLEHNATPDFWDEILAKLNSKYNSKTVQFNLRNPDRLELTVYERQRSAQISRSLGSFQRSVSWIEGRATPEMVMGLDREKAVLTKNAQNK